MHSYLILSDFKSWRKNKPVIHIAVDITGKTHVEKTVSEVNQKLRLLASLTRHDIISHIHIIRAFHSPWREKSDPDEILSYISCAQDQETGLSL